MCGRGEGGERERRGIYIVSGLYIPSINYFYGVTERREIMGIRSTSSDKGTQYKTSL